MPNNQTLRERAEIQYLLGNPPSWMMRYGITVMAGFFLLLLGLSCVIKYPEVVHCRVILTSTNPPIRVISKNTGRIQTLLVAEKAVVEPRQLLAVFENTAKYEDVLRLETWLATAHEASEKLPESLILGDLQAIYSNFSQHWQDFQFFQAAHDGGAQQKIYGLRQQITQLGRMNENLARQRDIFKEEFALAEKDRARRQKMRDEKLLSEADFEKSQAERLQQKRQLEQATASILQNQMQIRQLKAQISDFQQSAHESQNSKKTTIAEDIRRLQSTIADWKNKFLVESPVAGRVSLSKIWTSGLPINAGDEILAIVPQQNDSLEHTPSILAKAEIPASTVEKIKIGMISSIQLDGFKMQETGSVAASVSDVALIPQKEMYSISMKIIWPIQSNQGKNIPFRAEMSGEGRIFLAEKTIFKRLLQRVFEMTHV